MTEIRIIRLKMTEIRIIRLKKEEKEKRNNKKNHLIKIGLYCEVQTNWPEVGFYSITPLLVSGQAS